MVRQGTRDAAEELAKQLRLEVEPLVDRAAAGTAELVAAAGPLVAAAGPLVASAVETVSGVLEDAGSRGGAAWDALRGEQLTAVPVRRWPWAIGAALAGAAAAAAVNYAVARVRTTDAPEAVEPEQLQAVVDRPEPVVSTS